MNESITQCGEGGGDNQGSGWSDLNTKLRVIFIWKPLPACYFTNSFAWRVTTYHRFSYSQNNAIPFSTWECRMKLHNQGVRQPMNRPNVQNNVKHDCGYLLAIYWSLLDLNELDQCIAGSNTFTCTVPAEGRAVVLYKHVASTFTGKENEKNKTVDTGNLTRKQSTRNTQ